MRRAHAMITNCSACVRVAAVFAATLMASPASGQHGVRAISDLHHTAWHGGKELPIPSVIEMVRTPDGYLWLGSTAGLVRFDGVRFVLLNDANTPAFRSSGKSPTGDRSAPRIAPLLVDRSGTMWVRRADGSLLNYRNGQFQVALVAKNGVPPINGLVQDGQGRIWVFGRQHVQLLANGHLTAPPLPDSLWRSGLDVIVADTGRGIWLSTRGGRLWHIPDDGTPRLVVDTTPAEVVTPLLQTRDGALFAQGRGLVVFAHGKMTTARLPRAPGSAITPLPRIPIAAVEGKDGSVWITSSGDGVFRWRHGELEQFTVRDGLTSANAERVLLDNEGSLWITTQSGLDRLRTAAFVTIGPSSTVPIETPLLAFPDASGGVWTMDYGSLQVFMLSGGIASGVEGPTIATRAPYKDVLLAGAVSGDLWMFRLHSDVVMRLKNGRAERVAPTPALAWSGPRVGFEAADSTLWIGNRSGGFGYVRQLVYHPVALHGGVAMYDTIGAGAAKIGVIIGGADGRIWVSERDQPVVHEIARDGSSRRFDYRLLFSSPLRTLAHVGGDTLWATTLDGALVRIINGRATSVVVPDVRSAIVAGSVTLSATRDHVWLGSQGGIGRLPLRALNDAADGGTTRPVVEWFNEADGLTSARTTNNDSHPGFRAADGRLWFTTPAGLAVVDPEAVPANPVAPIPLIEEMLVAHGAETSSGATELAPNPDRVEIHFTATSLRVPERVRIFYRLEGADPDWVPGNSSRVATYSRLRVGRYRFRVRAVNESGVPSAQEATMSFRVMPAFYQTGSFVVLVLLVLTSAAAGIAVFFQRRQHRVTTERIRERYETAMEERTRVARELHDTLLQGFSGLTLQLQALKLSLPDSAEAARERLSRVLLLADDTLRDARHSIWDMRSPELESRGLEDALEAAAKEAVAEPPTMLQFSVRGTSRPLTPAVETALLRIAKEAITNAVRHGACRCVKVELAYAAREVSLYVEDDGCGFYAHAAATASKAGHFGIAGMRERAIRVGGTFAIDGVPGEGTKVVLVIPIAAAARDTAHASDE